MMLDAFCKNFDAKCQLSPSEIFWRYLADDGQDGDREVFSAVPSPFGKDILYEFLGGYVE
jgi:hypothetical protein